ncbi:DUF2141 domain-containing protein [Sphingomonas sp. BAUL-RG-20F-R05-02]|uniref:DUF2141 domain-containing protein n=1 Tax=Sphingomonas sp. BAUL-RG-20F-R05-02 TaxID=2914830 RepID=UPI001F57A83E|nr:DUF2141 domain-containing protein [Sphingomonas sp. BAUL-RG-20F-R05-02]
MTPVLASAPLRIAAVMMMAALASAPVLARGGATATTTGTLRVEVGNVRTAQGRVHIYVCTEAQFLKTCPLKAEAPARPGMTVVTVNGLPAGRYAVQAFLDENGNGKLDRALFGVPKEGVGFSNDARIKLAPPKWSDAVFDATGADQTIKFNLRYFIGGDARR